jgi:hypothetical protein
MDFERIKAPCSYRLDEKLAGPELIHHGRFARRAISMAAP